MPSKPNKATDDKPIRVLVVDDHPHVRYGVRISADQHDDVDICGEAEDILGALKVAEETQPDVAVIDLVLQEESGLELIREMRSRFPKLAMIVLSMRDEAFYTERVLNAGARGFVSKNEAPEVLVDGIRQVARGQVFVSSRMASHLMGKMVDGTKADKPSMEKLTDRELQVFELIGQGLDTSDIADRLHISTHTVETHRERIKRKLNLETAGELRKNAILWLQGQQRT